MPTAHCMRADALRHPRARHEKAPPKRGFSTTASEALDQSASVSSEALPPAAVVLIVIVFSVVKRGR